MAGLGDGNEGAYEYVCVWVCFLRAFALRVSAVERGFWARALEFCIRFSF